MTKKIWDEESIKILKEKYSTTPIAELEKILPFKGQQISKKAYTLGLKKEEDAYVIKIWNGEETALLKENYQTKTVKEISELLNNKFSEQQIRNKITALKLSKINKWTPELEAYLLGNYKKKTIKEMQKEKLTGFTEGAIYKKLNNLGILIGNFMHWSKEEEEIMKKFYPLRTNDEMLELLPRYTKGQIKSKAKNMGIKKLPIIMYKSKITCHRNDLWSDDERKILIEHYGKIPNKLIKEEYLPNRSLSAIKKQANKLNLDDKLRYKFQWEATEANYDLNEPDSVTVYLEKRRLDLC